MTGEKGKEIRINTPTLTQTLSRESPALNFTLTPEHLYLRVTIVTDENSRLWIIGEVFDSSGTDVYGTAQFISCRPHQLKQEKRKIDVCFSAEQ